MSKLFQDGRCLPGGALRGLTSVSEERQPHDLHEPQIGRGNGGWNSQLHIRMDSKGSSRGS